jgi:putrescine importer
VGNPKRKILLAGVVVCLFTGVFCVLQAYLAQRVWPDYRSYPHVETAFMDVSGIVGHAWLFHAMAVSLLVMSLACGITGQLGAARLLLSMGRDNVLPRRPFGYLGRTNVPSANVLILGVVAFLFTRIFSYELAAEMLNFGAFLAFMGVNFSCFTHFYWRAPEGHKRHLLKDAVVPLGGFLFCL